MRRRKESGVNLFPVFFNLADKPVTVVGAGAIAERKVKLLLRAGARVTVVAPAHTPWFRASAQAGVLQGVSAMFTPAHLDDSCLVIAATGRRDVNQAVALAAEQRRLPCNVVDDAQLSSIQVPAIIDRSPLIIAVSSAGSAPVLARRVRERIEGILEESLGPLAALAAQYRRDIKVAFPDVGLRRRFFDWLLDSDAQALLASGRPEEAATLLESALRRRRHSKQVQISILPIADLSAADLLTLRALRALNQADCILHLPGILPAILEKARRDADVLALDQEGGILQEDLLNPAFWGRLRLAWSQGERIAILWRSDWDAQALAAILKQEGLSCTVF